MSETRGWTWGPSACLAPLPFCISRPWGQVLRKQLRIILFLMVWLGISFFPQLPFHWLFGGCKVIPSGRQTGGSFLTPKMLQFLLFRCHMTAAKQGICSCKMVCSEMERCFFWSSQTWVPHDLHVEGMWKLKGITIASWDVLHTRNREAFARINKESREKK